MGYQALNDLQGNPVLVMRAQAHRDILKKGRSTLLYLAGGLLVVGIVFILLTLRLLEKQVLSRLVALGEKLAAIGAKGELDARVSITGNDERSNVYGRCFKVSVNCRKFCEACRKLFRMSSIFSPLALSVRSS